MASRQQISAARRVLQVVDDDFQDVIGMACVMVQFAAQYGDKPNQPTKRQLNSYLAAISRLQTKHKKLPATLRQTFFVSVDFEKAKADAKLLLDVPRAKPKRDAYAKMLAAKEAQVILKRYGRDVVTTRGGKWCQLAAILYGDKSADLFYQCCELKKKSNLKSD